MIRKRNKLYALTLMLSVSCNGGMNGEEFFYVINQDFPFW